MRLRLWLRLWTLTFLSLSERLTFWAVTIAARVIDRAAVSATVAGFEMTAERRSATLAQVSDHLTLDGAHPMGLGMTLPI